MSDQEVSLHRVRGFVSGVNWRVTKFTHAVPRHITCGLCHVISPATVLLPCLHTLCASCASRTASDGNIVCPFDQESFATGVCQKAHLQPATVDRLKACCWNEPRGCTFVGTLQAVLTHYDQECTFHAATCPRCNNDVLQHDLPSHYSAGCRGDSIAPAHGEPTFSRGLTVSADDIRTCLDELKALIRDPYQDRLPALQSKMNEILEEARNIDTQVEAIARICRESEHRLTQTLGELLTTLGRKIESQDALIAAHLKKNPQINDISVQVKNHGIRIDAIAKALSDSESKITDQLAEATQTLSTNLCRKTSVSTT
ncbi:hypothetical protein HPB48_008012 [Haemaphysalis longicornis]|uniref:RING-type domain-containing protein n=1 Tax=Haemaphysalis longicornis TaxID=44386 RepID=A0A9J6FLI5_HAELO|nr:hypothetical protein HPB48_008012 [Haemaphysalis longicornis]